MDSSSVARADARDAKSRLNAEQIDPRAVWLSEPAAKSWVDEASGYRCELRRGPVGAWCGYVGVPAGHPAFGRTYHKSDYSIAEVLSGAAAKDAPIQARVNELTAHGGLTYADDDCGGGGGAPGLWWFGFDCAHAGDYSPAMDRLDHPVLGLGKPTGWGSIITYRDMAYAEAEAISLARQLLALSSEEQPSVCEQREQAAPATDEQQ